MSTRCLTLMCMGPRVHGLVPRARDTLPTGSKLSCARAIQELFLLDFCLSPCQSSLHLYSFVFLALCCWVFVCVSDSADKRSELRRKRAKGGSKDYTITRRQPSEGMGQGSGSGQGRVRRAASKRPVVEAFNDSEE